MHVDARGCTWIHHGNVDAQWMHHGNVDAPEGNVHEIEDWHETSMCFVAASRSRLTLRLRCSRKFSFRKRAFRVLTARNHRPKSTQMAVNSALKAPQATRDLGMARADRSAGWFPGEHAEARTTTARSVSPYAPVFPSWDWASRPFIHVRRLCLCVVCGIPRSECVICRVPLFHRHDHTPHYDSAIRQLALFLPQVAGAAQEPRARFATNTVHLLFCILGRSRYVEPAENE